MTSTTVDNGYEIGAVSAVAIPASNAGRKEIPNPLLPVVTQAVDARKALGVDQVQQAVSFTVAYGTDEIGNTREAGIKRDLTKAGQKLGVMVRRNVERDVSAKLIKVTFWIADKPEPKADVTPDPVKDAKK